MMRADAAVGSTKRDPPGRAMGDEKTVERVASPVEWQSMANYRFQRDVATVNLSENFKPVRFQGRS
jgi:hypothetical protein